MGQKEGRGRRAITLLSIFFLLVIFCVFYTSMSSTTLRSMLPHVRIINYVQKEENTDELTARHLKETENQLADTEDQLADTEDQLADSEDQLAISEDQLANSEDLQKAIQLAKELQEAKRLYKGVRILCWVLMYPKAHETKARHIRATWGRRCNKLIFMSTKDDPSVGAVDVGSREGYTKLWNKTRCAVRYIYEHHLRDFEWFLKADSDTYVLVDNLRYVLQDYDTNDPLYFGQHYKIYGGYNTGGAGHVMGREAVRRFVEKAIPNHTICKPERSKGEDVGMGNCLQKVGIKMGDTRDHLGQGRFWQRHPAKVLSRPLDRTRHSYYPISQGNRPHPCCSDSLISFHKLSIEELYLLDYLIYKVRVFGHIPFLPLKPPLPPDLSVVPEETIKKYRKYDRQLPSPVTESTTETTEVETTE